MKKKKTYENFIYPFKKCFTWNAIQNSFEKKKKKTFSCEKVYHSFGLTLQVFYQFFKSQKSQITR